MSEIYKRIKARREELNLSQDELAKRMGYKSRSSIAKIESGENDIPQSKVEAFAKALFTTPSYLMGYSETSEETSPVPELENVYFRFAKEAQDSGIDPEDIRMALDTIKRIREK